MDKNIYPESITIEKKMIPIIRISVINHIDELREDCKRNVDNHHFQAAFEDLNELVFVTEFIKELDKKIKFDESDEPDFEIEF